jgi:hypothetical protein
MPYLDIPYNGLVLQCLQGYGLPAAGNRVSQWDDQSGLAHHLLQGTAGRQPIVGDAGGGRKYIRFDKTRPDSLQAVYTLPQPATVFLVAKSVDNGVATNQYYLDGCGSSDRGSMVCVIPGGVGATKVYAGAFLPTAHNGGQVGIGGFSIACLQFNGTNSSFILDGVTRVTGDAGALAIGGTTVGQCGGDPTSLIYGANIDVMAVVVYNRALSQQEIAQVRLALAADCGLATDHAPYYGAGLVGEYHADRLGAIGSSIATWSDYSGLAHDLLQATPARQPIVADLGGGNKAAWFTPINSDKHLNAVFATAQPTEVFIVGRIHNEGAGWLCDTGTLYNRFLIFRAATRRIYVSNGAGQLIGNIDQPPTGTFAVMHGSFNGASSVETYNGTTVAAGAVGVGASDGFSLGGTVADVLNADMDIVCALLYNRTLLPSEREKVLRFLLTRYPYATLSSVFSPHNGVPKLIRSGLVLECLPDGLPAIGSPVDTWTDTSGLAHHLLKLSDPTRPTVVDSGNNGKKACRFVAASTQHLRASFTLNHPCDVFMVMKNTAPGVTSAVACDGSVVETLAISLNPTNSSIYAKTFVTYPRVVCSNKYSILRGSFNAAASKFYEDDFLRAGPGTCGIGTNPGGMTVGMWATGGSDLSGDVEAIVIYDHILTDEEWSYNLWALKTACSLQTVPDVPATIDWGSVAQPANVAYTRTGTWYLIDNAAQSHVTAFAANVWGTEMDATGARYTPVRPGYTNIVTSPRLHAGWVAGDGTNTETGGQTGPDGTANAWREQVLSGGWSPYIGPNILTNGVSYYGYWWMQNHPASIVTAYCSNIVLNTVFCPAVSYGVSAGAAWNRKGATRVADGVLLTVRPNEGRNLPAGAGAADRDGDFDMPQVTASTYALPYSDGAVGITSIAIPGSRIVGPSGYFDVTLCPTKCVAKEDSTVAGGTRHLLYISSTTYFCYDGSDDKFKLYVSGVLVASSLAQVYAADANLGTVRVWSRADGCGFTVNGVTLTGVAQLPIAVPLLCYVGSITGSANVFPMDLYGTMSTVWL